MTGDEAGGGEVVAARDEESSGGKVAELLADVAGTG